MRIARDLDPSALAVEANAAKIAAVNNRLDAGNRARRKEREHRIPIVRRRVLKSARTVTVVFHRIITVTQSRASRALTKTSERRLASRLYRRINLSPNRRSRGCRD